MSQTSTPAKNASSARSTPVKKSSAACSDPSGFAGEFLREAERPRLEQHDLGAGARLLRFSTSCAGPWAQSVRKCSAKASPEISGAASNTLWPSSAQSLPAASVAALTSGSGSSPK